ncbi:hypothetical protein LFL96_36740 (plasmid) [Paraburkholderia sp. D15]|uniref:hypothetical protein n=1 Tax=Paraburkholderia sp. D15 TaxID=2880218 RepID=UPI0024796365|nr:hypothetical protein [Paraburkholderia sp. D15]WGS55026.1 hypothetical protein LFL96_36740 [Paraburkholderia sp. D15]
MTNNSTDSSAEPTIDRSTFTEAQWEALSLYVEARKRQRGFYRTALPALGLVVLAWGVTHVLQSGPSRSAFVPEWLQTTVTAAAVTAGLFGVGLFRWAVRQSRAHLKASGVSTEWIAGLDRWPLK